MDMNEVGFVFIKEAGEHCQRDADPYRYGMQLNQTTTCSKDRTNNSQHANTDASHQSNEQMNTQIKSITPVVPLVVAVDKITSNVVHRHSNNRSTFDDNNISDITRPTIEIGYDYFDENRSNVNVATTTEVRHRENHDQFNETVQFVNIKRVNLYENNDNNDIVDNESDSNELHTTTRRTMDIKRTHSTKNQSKHEQTDFDYNMSSSFKQNYCHLIVWCACTIILSQLNA